MKFLRLAAAVLCAVAVLPAHAATPPDTAAYDRLFDQAMAQYQLPGLAVGVIEDGKVVFRRTGGERIAGSGEAIDADTLFKIASNSKAMTTGLLARLVDQGKLAWDDPVTQYLPEFRMYDPWVTQNIQVRDLLIHNSGLGLGAGDLMLWPEPNDFSRADIIAGLAHLKPTHSFRAHYAYDNLLYVVAGEVAARAGGKPYDQLIRQELFAPLGMTRCQVGAWQQSKVGNIAQPHMRAEGKNVPVREDGDTVADLPSMAAGGIRCSLDDMLTWMDRAWLRPDPQQPWLSETQRRAVWSLHTPMPISQRMRDWDGTHLYGYGYGWRLSDVDGQWKVAHTGTLMGMYSSLVLLPERRSGFIILINGEGEAARTALGEALQKRLLGADPALDVLHYAKALAREQAQPKPPAARKPDTTARTPVPAAGAKTRAGRYNDPWFGDIRLCPEANGLTFASARSPMLRGAVMQVGGRWLVDWIDPSVDAEPWLDFARDAQGRDILRLRAIDPDADFSYDYGDLEFHRVGDCP